MSDQQDTGSEGPGIVDLTALPPGTRVRVDGSDELVDPVHVVSKSVLTKAQMALAEERQNLAEASDLYQALIDDPAGFADEINARLGRSSPSMTQPQTGDVPAPRGGPKVSDQAPEPDPNTVALNNKVSWLEQQLLGQTVDGQMRTEVAQIQADYARAHDGAQITPEQLNQIYQITANERYPNLIAAYKTWDGYAARNELEQAREKLRVLERNAKHPYLGGGAESPGVSTSKKMTLDEVFRKHVSDL